MAEPSAAWKWGSGAALFAAVLVLAYFSYYAIQLPKYGATAVGQDIDAAAAAIAAARAANPSLAKLHDANKQLAALSARSAKLAAEAAAITQKGAQLETTVAAAKAAVTSGKHMGIRWTDAGSEWTIRDGGDGPVYYGPSGKMVAAWSGAGPSLTVGGTLHTPYVAVRRATNAVVSTTNASGSISFPSSG